MTYQYVWFDGSMINEKNATVSIATHAIHYGTSIFEGIRGYWNGTQLNIFRLGDHVKRFKRSGEYYSISSRYTNAAITKAILDVCRKNKVRKSCYIRPFYFVVAAYVSFMIQKYGIIVPARFCLPSGYDGIQIVTACL